MVMTKHADSIEAAQNKWDAFIIANYLQDAVEIGEGGHFGIPKELWNGHFSKDVLPQEYVEFTEFWENARAQIFDRSIRLKNAIDEYGFVGNEIRL